MAAVAFTDSDIKSLSDAQSHLYCDLLRAAYPGYLAK